MTFKECVRDCGIYDDNNIEQIHKTALIVTKQSSEYLDNLANTLQWCVIMVAVMYIAGSNKNKHITPDDVLSEMLNQF